MENQTEPQAARKRQPKLSSDKALPATGTDRLLLILKGYVIATSEGATPSGYKEVASLTDMHPTEVSRNNSFLEESGFLKFVRSGQYLPVPPVIQYVKEEPWDQEQAKIALRPVVEDTWYAEQAKNLLRVRSSVTDEQAITALGRYAAAPPGRKKDIATLLEVLLYVGILTRDDSGTLSVASLKSVAPDQSEPQKVPSPVPKQSDTEWGQILFPDRFASSLASLPTAPSLQVQLSLHVPEHLDDEYLHRLRRLLRMLGYKTSEASAD